MKGILELAVEEFVLKNEKRISGGQIRGSRGWMVGEMKIREVWNKKNRSTLDF